MNSKPTFWFAGLLVIAGLVWFAVHRASTKEAADASRPTTEAKTGGNGAAPEAGGAVLELAFHSSSAKKTWVNKMVADFNGAKHQVGGQTIKVKVTHVESGQSLDDIKTGKSKPDVWSPGDESWIQLASSHWRNVHQSELLGPSKPLLKVPLVIAMWEPMARALGYPNPIGWKDVAKLAASPKGWAEVNHPEWGRFRWGHAHPDANSGFLTIIAEVYAALGRREGITAEDLRNPQVVNFVRDFEGAVEHYGLSNSWIDDFMHQKGPSYLSCAVQYENTVIESNEKHQNRPFKMVAIYPSEGTFWTQHPVAVVKESWVTPEKAEAGQKFVDFLLSREAQSQAMQLGLRPVLEEVALAAPFDEAHGVRIDVGGTPAFTVPDESVLKRIRDLWEDVKVPATVLMVIDRSGSMNGAPMDGARAGAVSFVKSMKPRDQLMVVAFSDKVNDLLPLCEVKDCGERAVSQVEGIFAEGGTALHDAVAHAYQQVTSLRSANPKRRYSVLLLSDGQDTASNMKKHDFLDTLPKGEQVEVPKIFSIAYGDEADRDLLQEVSNRTNGRIFKSSPEEIMKTYKELSANF